MGLAAFKMEDGNMRKRILIICLAGAIAINIFYLRYSGIRQTADKNVTNIGTGGPQGPEQQVTSFTLDGSSAQGSRQWHLEGDSAEIVGEDIHLTDLKAIVYNEDTSIDIVSRKGVFNREKGVVELLGDVRVFSDQGTVLSTENARWSQITKDISSDSFVKVEHDSMTATGTGAVANSDNKTASLLENVEVIIQPHTKVKCDGPMKIDYDKNIAVFNKGVVVVDKDGKMSSDMLTVYFDRVSKQLAQVVAVGNVKMKRGKSYTISEKAIYSGSTKSAQLLGNPRVVIAPEELEEFQEMPDNLDKHI